MNAAERLRAVRQELEALMMEAREARRDAEGPTKTRLRRLGDKLQAAANAARIAQEEAEPHGAL